MNSLVPYAGFGRINYNHSFTNLKVVPKNLLKSLNCNFDYYNVSYDNITEYNLSLENVTKIKIENITGKKDWNYNYTVGAIDFNLTINGDNYPYPHTVPKNETFARPTGIKNRLFGTQNQGKMDYNHKLDNLSIVPLDLTGELNWFDRSFFNVSCNGVTDLTFVIGNASYIPIDDTIPVEQEDYVFLLDEEVGVENQLDNVTSNASAVILIHNYSVQAEQQYYANTTNYTTLQIGRTKDTDSSNLTTVLEMLQK